jgi:hypothetical protein
MMLLPFILLGCKPNAGLVSKPNDVIVNKPIEILYKVKENEVASTLKYASDELEGEREWDSRNGKSADYLVEFLKEQCKALFFFVSRYDN